MNNKTIVALTTGFLIGVLSAPASGHKSRKKLSDIYSKIRNKFRSRYSKQDELDIVTLKQEINQLEDKLSLKSKITLNNLIGHLDKNSKN